MSFSPQLRCLTAPLLLVLVLAGVSAETWGHHHDLGEDALHGAGGEVLLCASGSQALHVEAALAVEISLCEVCLLRAHDRGNRAALAASPAPLPDPAAWVVATDPRIDSLGTAGPPGSRGPPSPTVVS